MAEVQFLDNLRRGASINYADLQPNPVPANLGEAYRLLSVIAPQASLLLAAPVVALLGRLLTSCRLCQPTGAFLLLHVEQQQPCHTQWAAGLSPSSCISSLQVSMLENGIRILQEEVQARRVRCAKEPCTALLASLRAGAAGRPLWEVAPGV